MIDLVEEWKEGICTDQWDKGDCWSKDVGGLLDGSNHHSLVFPNPGISERWEDIHNLNFFCISFVALYNLWNGARSIFQWSFVHLICHPEVQGQWTVEYFYIFQTLCKCIWLVDLLQGAVNQNVSAGFCQRLVVKDTTQKQALKLLFIDNHHCWNYSGLLLYFKIPKNFLFLCQTWNLHGLRPLNPWCMSGPNKVAFPFLPLTQKVLRTYGRTDI